MEDVRWEGAERAGAVQSQKVKAQGNLINYKYLRGEGKKMEPDLVVSGEGKSQCHKLRCRKWILFKHKKKLPHFQAAEKIAQRGCGIAVCEVIQTTSGHGPEQPVPAVAAWSRGLCDLLRCLPALTFLWIYKMETLLPCYTEAQALLNLQSQ